MNKIKKIINVLFILGIEALAEVFILAIAAVIAIGISSGKINENIGIFWLFLLIGVILRFISGILKDNLKKE